MNQMNKIRLGIIGVGHLGKLHATLIKEIEDAELIGIYDTDPSKAETVSSELKIRKFENREELFQAVDAINIVTPTSFHHETALQALKYNCDLT